MVYRDDMGKLEDLLWRSMRNLGILKWSLIVESLLQILTKRKRSQTFYKPVDAHSITNTIGEGISSIIIWNIVNQVRMIFLVGR